MNDLLAMYPKDHRTAFLAGRWLVHQRRYAQGIFVLQHAVALFPDYPAAINELAYAYAFSGNFEKASALMERYVQLQPDQPNPYDSYGEILRAAGQYDAALDTAGQSGSIRLSAPNSAWRILTRSWDAKKKHARNMPKP